MIKIKSYRFILAVKVSYLFNTMLQTVEFPAGVTDLGSSLADVNVDALSLQEGGLVLFRIYFRF